jgi:hypothetical protein
MMPLLSLPVTKVIGPRPLFELLLDLLPELHPASTNAAIPATETAVNIDLDRMYMSSLSMEPKALQTCP